MANNRQQADLARRMELVGRIRPKYEAYLSQNGLESGPDAACSFAGGLAAHDRLGIPERQLIMELAGSVPDWYD